MISDDGTVFMISSRFDDILHICCSEIDDLEYYNGYLIVPNKYLTKKVSSMPGQYLHRMVVYSWGDCNHKPFKEYPNFEIDHIDLNHNNNNVSNLQLVSHGINLFRAYRKCGGKIDGTSNCCSRFKEYYKSLDDFDKKVLDKEIELDLEGRLK